MFVSDFFTSFFSCLYHFPLLHSQTNFDAAVEPLDTHKTRTNGDYKFERAVYGEHLVKKVLTNFADEFHFQKWTIKLLLACPDLLRIS